MTQPPAYTPRTLLSCFACDPAAGSEPYVGWHWASEVYGHEHRMVLTRRHHRQALAPHESELLTFRYFDLPGLGGLDHRHRLMKLYYIIWQICVLPYATWLVWRHRLNHVHHITYNAVDFPGILWLVPGARFIWGPVGGGQTPPESLRSYYGDAWRRQKLRSLSKRALRFNPFVRGALWRASIVLAANAETRQPLQAMIRDPGRVRQMLETAITEVSEPRTACAERIRVLWIGRFEHRKAPGLLIDIARAMQARHPGRFAFRMIGGGPLLEETRVAAKDIPGVSVETELPFPEIADAYRNADILAFTSLQDTSGNVVLEAMSQGLPVVALDHQGVGEILRSGGGLSVPVGTPTEVIDGFCSNLESAALPETYVELSRAAVANMKAHHTWSAKARDWRGRTLTGKTTALVTGPAESA